MQFTVALLIDYEEPDGARTSARIQTVLKSGERQIFRI